MPKFGTNTVIANGILLNGDGPPCVILNGDGPPCVLMNGDGPPFVLVNSDFHLSNGVHLHMQFLNAEIHI